LLQPLHWIYDKEKLADALKGIEDAPEFRSESRCPFYRIETGRLSGYGDQAFVLIDACSALAKKHKGGTELPVFDREEYVAAVFRHFGPGTEYDPTATTEYHEEGTPSGKTKRYEASKHEKWPISGPWLHHSLKDFNQAVVEGQPWPQGSTDDKQADAAAKIAPVVCLYAPYVAAASDESACAAAIAALYGAIDDATRTTQNDDVTVSSAKAVGRVILEVLLGATPSEAVATARDALVGADRLVPLDSDAAMADALGAILAEPLRSKPHGEVVDTLKNTCMLPQSVQNPLHAAVNAPLDSDGFLRTSRTTLVASGCNCSRLCILGAVLGAAVGEGGLPASWVDRTLTAAHVRDAAAAIASVRESD
jgi:hypothetical protein